MGPTFWPCLKNDFWNICLYYLSISKIAPCTQVLAPPLRPPRFLGKNGFSSRKFVREASPLDSGWSLCNVGLFFSKNSVALIPNVCVRTQSRTTAALSAALLSSHQTLGVRYSSNPGMFSSDHTNNHVWHPKFFHFPTLQGLTAILLRNTITVTHGQLKDSHQWGKNTRDNNSTSVNEAGRKPMTLTHHCQLQINIWEKFADWR